MTPSPTLSEGEAMRWQCPQCGYSVTPNEILSVRKHFSAHALECVRCLYRTETKGTWDEAIAAYRRAAAQSSGVREALIEARETLRSLDHPNGFDNALAMVRSGKRIGDLIDAALSPDTPREGEK